MMPVNIRAIQHYLYCPRRFGLLEINMDWAENAFVVKANIMHERVHSAEHKFSGRNGFSRSSITLYNDELDIFGVADCIEFEASRNGEYVFKNKTYHVKIVEYKPTRPKDGSISETDAIQVFAQKLCADHIFNSNCEAYIYYSDVKRRTKLPFDTEYDRYYSLTLQLVQEMREILENGRIPQKLKGQKCSGCSLKDICMPKNTHVSVKKQIFDEIEDNM